MIYFHSFSVENIEQNQIIELYSIANHFETESLIQCCSDMLIASLNKENVFKFFKEVILEKSITKFKPFFIDFFVDELDSIINEKEFEELDKEIILDIFKKKEIKVEEMLKKLENSDSGSDSDSDY
jgi:hypothetical protein